jgi:hypothetical protein
MHIFVIHLIQVFRKILAYYDLIFILTKILRKIMKNYMKSMHANVEWKRTLLFYFPLLVDKEFW